MPPEHGTKPATKTPAEPVKKVDLNNASLAELKTLPTVNDEYAKKIIAHRPYQSKGELVTKAGLPEGVYSRCQAQGRNANAAQNRAEEVRESSMKRLIAWCVAAAVVLVALSGCGGGNDGGGLAAPAPPPALPSTGTAPSQAIASAATNPANDTSINSSSAFKVLQDSGVAAVTVAGVPVVNFTVFSDGAVKQGLTLSNVSLAIAKLVPGTNGEIDQWQSYVVRTETTTGSNAVGSGPGGTPVLASAVQASTDPKPTSQANQLVYNANGYYTYTFSTDITDPTKTNGVVFEPNRTHRVAIQLSYTNAAGATVLVNPYFDVTFDASGKSVAVTDPSKTRVDGRRELMQRLPREAGAARRRTRRHAVLRDVPQPRHDRRQQRQRADDADDGAQDPLWPAAGKPGRDQGGEDYTIWGYKERASTTTPRSASRRICATAPSATARRTRRRRRATTGRLARARSRA